MNNKLLPITVRNIIATPSADENPGSSTRTTRSQKRSLSPEATQNVQNIFTEIASPDCGPIHKKAKRDTAAVTVLSPITVQNVQPVDEVCVIDISEFVAQLYPQPPRGARERLDSFLGFFTQIQDNDGDAWRLWLDATGMLPPKTDGRGRQPKDLYLLLEVTKGEFESQCFSKQSDPGKSSDHYYYINAFSDPGNRKPYLQIRLAPDLSSAEIMHIGKYGKLTGGQMKDLGLQILDYLKPATTYLGDDAQIKSSNPPILLRVLLPIVHKDPKTWYTPNGFELMEYGLKGGNLFNPQDKELLPQSSELYHSHIQTVRDAPISDNIIGAKQLREAYTQPENCTMHALGSAIYQASKDPLHRKNRSAHRDLAKFFELFLLYTDPFKGQAPMPYQLAVNTLHEFQIFKRT